MTAQLPDTAGSAAVLVGCGSYDGGLAQLGAVRNNVTDLAALLTSPELWGLSPNRCLTILDPPDAVAMLGSALPLVEEAPDTLIFYYAGHGLTDARGDLILTGRRADPRLPGVAGLAYAQLRSIVGASRAQRRLVVLDCCFSGIAALAMSDVPTAIWRQLDVEGTFVLTSSPSNQTSVASDGGRYTAFTGGLITILRDGIADGGDPLTLNEIYEQLLRVMVRGGLPRPQHLCSNTVRGLHLVRNAALHRRSSAPVAALADDELLGGTVSNGGAPGVASPSRPGPDPTRQRRVAEGVRLAVDAVSPTLGVPDRDGPSTLREAFPPGQSPDPAAEGVELVRETMAVMRQQYGDGAATAALLLGDLVAGLQSLLERGTQTPDADELSSAVGRLSELVRADLAPDELEEEALAAAVRTAVGPGEICDQVVAAVRVAGASNVEIVPGDAVTGVTASTFTFGTYTLAPNGSPGPHLLHNPVVAVCIDGRLDAGALARAADGRQQVLVITPRLSIADARMLLHAFTRMVVVRPTAPGFDLVGLQNRFRYQDTRYGWAHADRALVLRDRTTIERPGTDLQLGCDRVTLRIGDPERDCRMDNATRALAVARSAAEAGASAGGGAGLREAAAALRRGEDGRSILAELVATAACRPAEVVLLNRAIAACGGPVDPPTVAAGPLDPVATVQGALRQAAATAERFLVTG